MGYDDFVEYGLKHYRVMFPRDTLKFLDRNLVNAYQAYIIGVMEGLTRRPAVTRFWGFRYRRLENFLTELDMYDVEHGAWTVQLALLKCKGTYEPETQEEKVEFDFELWAHKPFHLDETNDPFLNTLFENCIVLTEDFARTPVKFGKWEYDVVRHEKQVYDEEIDDCKAKMVVIVDKMGYKKYKYEYGFSVEVSKYTVWGEEKEGVYPHLWQVMTYYRPLD